MSPELERLLRAMYERETCAPAERPKWEATVRRLVTDAVAKLPGTSYERFTEAVWERYKAFRRAHRKPPTMPLKA
jgi:hypothetical protein